jgi:hypothetical protein
MPYRTPFAARALLALLPLLAASPAGGHLFYRDGARVGLLLAGGAEACGTLPDPYFEWEGRSGSYRFANTCAGECEAHWKLDVAGPNWLYVDVVFGDAIRVHAHNSNEVLLDAFAEFDDYDAMLASDDPCALWVKACWGRVATNPDLPALSTIRAVYFGKPDPMGKGVRERVVAEIEKLDDADWRVREAATERLRRRDLVEHLSEVAGPMDLSPEQHARVERVLGGYCIVTTKEELEALRALAFGPPSSRSPIHSEPPRP